MKDKDESHSLKSIVLVLTAAIAYRIFISIEGVERLLLIIAFAGSVTILGLFLWDRMSKRGRDAKKRYEHLQTIPRYLLQKADAAVYMGTDLDLNAPIFLPDSVRSRHVHLIGATGSGKTDSVILNFLKQDVSRGFGSIVLDAKGDASFLEELRVCVPESMLKVFDLSDEDSLGYDPLASGSALEAAQRLFSSLIWSEEYYKSKALSSLQRLFQVHFETYARNPKLTELAAYLESPASYIAVTKSPGYPMKLAESDFKELSGLRDQVRSLCIGHLNRTMSPCGGEGISLRDAQSGSVIYFRLQSLLSPQLVSVLGKLIINHLSYLSGTVHRKASSKLKRCFVPVYFDEFASFACPEFADLISKARSAGFALHFSHQSTGDVAEVSKGFMTQITDNSATKIVMRINDPDSAEFFARAFGTKLVQKVTQRITNAKETDRGEAMGEGSQREAHQFRAAPDLMKTHPTGVGSVLIAHGEDTVQGASHVFRIKFPKLERKEKL